MSWWDTSQFSNLASAALKTAQNKIDKVLDIQEGGESKGANTQAATLATTPKSSQKPTEQSGDNFWKSWGVPGAESDPSSVLLSPEGAAASSHSQPREQIAAVAEEPAPAASEREATYPESISSVLPASGEDYAKPGWSNVDLSADDPTPVAESTPAIQTLDSSDVSEYAQLDVNTKRGPLKLGSKLKKREKRVSGGKAPTEPSTPAADVTETVVKTEIQATNKEVDNLLLTDLQPVISSVHVRDEADTMSEVDPDHLADSTPDIPADSVLDERENLQPHCDKSSDDTSGICLSVIQATDSFIDDPKQTAWGDDISLSILAESQGSNVEDLPGESAEAEMTICGEKSGEDKEEECPTDVTAPASPLPVIDDSVTSGPRHNETCSEQSAVVPVAVVQTVQSSDDAFSFAPIPSDSDSISTSTEVVTDSVIAEAKAQVPGLEGESGKDYTQELHVETSSPLPAAEQPTGTEKNDEGAQPPPELDWTKSSTCSSEAFDELSESNKTLTSSESNRTLEGEAAIPEVDDERDGETNKDSGAQTTSEGALSSSSYVKNMLEEAMTESMKDNDSHASHSSSDMVRVESGHTSGHTSADEIDTTTSSDIEIISHISTPTPNGDYGPVNRPFDLSPLRHALSRSVRRGSPPGHKRSDSSSSGTSYRSSHNGDDLISPVSSGGKSDPEAGESARGAEACAKGDDHGRNNPLETDKLLKTAPKLQLPPITETYESSSSELVKLRETPPDKGTLFKKLADMAQVLDAREKKLVEMSRDNIGLVEASSILRNQLQQSEESRESEQTDLTNLTEEFTERISEFERKMNQVLKEKEGMKRMLEQAEAEIIKKSDNTATQRLIAEKDQQISELLEEGEKLSKQQLQSNNIIKKLRAKEKENDTLVKSNSKKMDAQKEEIAKLKNVLDNKIDNEKNQTDLIHQLESAVQLQESELTRLKSEVEEYQEKNRSMQVALDNSYKEMAELHKAKAAHVSQTQSIALSAEVQAKEELRLTLEKFKYQARSDQESLINQIQDLQLSITRMEKEHGRREDVLRQEISDLQQRLQEAEERNQELTSSVSGATRPLLRQIENIQSTYTAQSASYDRVEKNLTERLTEAQVQLASAVEKERASSEAMMTVSTRVSSLESQASTLRQEKSRMRAQLEMERAKSELLEEAKNNESAQLEALRKSSNYDVSDLKKEKQLVENQLEMEKMRVDAEKKKLILVHEQLKDKELQLAQLETRAVTPPTLSGQASMQSSFMDASMNISAMSLSTMSVSQSDDMLEKSLMIGSANGSKVSLYDSLRHSGAASVLENLQSQLKQREGEIVQLQSEITELERTREAMARELVDLTNKNEELNEKLSGYPELMTQYKGLDGRYNAMLQMYGEKVEEADELRLDLQDVKDMYKSQIDHLLKGMGH